MRWTVKLSDGKIPQGFWEFQFHHRTLASIGGIENGGGSGAGFRPSLGRNLLIIILRL